jgi:hypothetical protein
MRNIKKWLRKNSNEVMSVYEDHLILKAEAFKRGNGLALQVANG